MRKLLLASSSPRRHEILRKLGIPFDVVKPECDESYPKSVRGWKIPVYLSEKKIRSVLEMRGASEEFILAADTVVLFRNKVLGKPSCREEAFEFLRRMQGKSHVVVTGLSFYSPSAQSAKPQSFSIEKTFSKTKVWFRKLSDDEINWYLDSGEWRDAAGGYKIQEKGAVLVRKMSGSYSNVVGLPISELYVILASHGFMSEASPL